MGNTPFVYSYSLDDDLADIAFVKKNYHNFVKRSYRFKEVNLFELVAKTAPVTINLSHAVDYFYIDKELQKESADKNMTLNLPQGEYELTFFKRNFYPLRRKIKVTENTKKFSWNLSEIKNSRTFSFTSPTPEVELYYDNFFIGHLPYQDRVINQKTYQFTFKKKNHQEKNLALSFSSLKNRDLNIVLNPLKNPTYQVEFNNLPENTIINVSRNQKSIYKGYYRKLDLVEGEYFLVLTHPNYLTRKKKIKLTQDENFNIPLLKAPPKNLNLIERKVLIEKESFAFSSLDHNAKYFFINDRAQRKKLVFDNQLNFTEEVDFPVAKHLLNPILDGQVFSGGGGFSFENTLFLQGTLYRYLKKQEREFRNIVFINRLGNRLLIIDEGYPAIFIYENRDDEWELLDEITPSKIENSPKNSSQEPRWRQAFFLNSEEIIFLEKTSRKIMGYDLAERKIIPFIKNLDNAPTIPEGMFFYDYLVFIKGENNKIFIFDENGDFLVSSNVLAMDKEVLNLIVKEKILYLFTASETYRYEL